MIMEHKCPHCGSVMIEYDGDECEHDWDSYFVDWDCHCEDCGRDFIISEAFTLRSCIVAKDDEELEKLLEQE